MPMVRPAHRRDRLVAARLWLLEAKHREERRGRAIYCAQASKLLT
jgi:hypothetical protein